MGHRYICLQFSGSDWDYSPITFSTSGKLRPPARIPHLNLHSHPLFAHFQLYFCFTFGLRTDSFTVFRFSLFQLRDNWIIAISMVCFTIFDGLFYFLNVLSAAFLLITRLNCYSLLLLRGKFDWFSLSAGSSQFPYEIAFSYFK